MFQFNTYAVVVVLCNTFYCFKYKPSITRLQKSSIECLTISKLPITVKLYSERLYQWKNVMSNISTTLSRSSRPEVFLGSNLQENTYAEVWFQYTCKATLWVFSGGFMFGMGALQSISSIFSEHLFLKTPGCGRLLLITHGQGNVMDRGR